MSAQIVSAAFGNPEAIRQAAIGSAAYNRALNMGYGRTAARVLAGQAKRCAHPTESPEAVASRLVPVRGHVIAPRGPGSAA